MTASTMTEEKLKEWLEELTEISKALLLKMITPWEKERERKDKDKDEHI